MKHFEFKIGEIFYTDAGKWRCTDIGTRVVVAIRLDCVRVVQTTGNRVTSEQVLDEAEADLKGWFNGPPYAVAEKVFDELDQEGCRVGDPWSDG